MAISARHLQLFIGGEFVDAQDGQSASVIDPATEQPIAEMALATAGDVDRAVVAARRALPRWSALSHGDRAAALLALADQIDEHADELAALESLDAGKPITAVREDELPIASDSLRLAAVAAGSLQRCAGRGKIADRTGDLPAQRAGVIGQFIPWNYPLLAGIVRAAVSLATGNSVILKPSAHTPLSVLAFAELATGVLPGGVLNVITGFHQQTGVALIEHPGVDVIQLTGSSRAGNWIPATRTTEAKRGHLELGGRAPVIIFDDVDLEAVVPRIATDGYYNAGQEWNAASRVMVAAELYDDFVASVAHQAEQYPIGDPGDPEIRIGPVISARHRARVQALLTERSASAEVVTGGAPLDRPGFFLEPTVVAGARQHDGVVTKEIFGPVITVQRFRDEDQAIEWANGTRWRLGASLWTRDIGRAHRVAAALEFPTVSINQHLPPSYRMPYGAYG
jgi:betaine-aldehyde dehydrogenase